MKTITTLVVVPFLTSGLCLALTNLVVNPLLAQNRSSLILSQHVFSTVHPERLLTFLQAIHERKLARESQRPNHPSHPQ